jgi:hypothetical protein
LSQLAGGQNLLVKLIVAQLPKKLPAFYETRSFNTVFTKAHLNEFHGAEPLMTKLIVSQMLRELPALYGIREFITMFTIGSHWSLF